MAVRSPSVKVRGWLPARRNGSGGTGDEVLGRIGRCRGRDGDDSCFVDVGVGDALCG